MQQAAAVIAGSGLIKRFPGQTALAGVDIHVDAGEIVGLVGENGSGKSTLIKCLAGYHTLDGGTIAVDGNRVGALTTSRARDLGLRFIHQDPGIFPSLTVSENIAIGSRFQNSGGTVVNRRRERQASIAIMSELDLAIDPDIPAGDLSQARRTMLAVARALTTSGDDGSPVRLLVLDEPTASLPAEEVESLFAVVKSVAARGIGVLYVSHRIEEIFTLTDRVIVLRDGQLVATEATTELSEQQLVELIVGATLSASLNAQADRHGEIGRSKRLAVERLGGNRLIDVSFSVHRGEVVGIAGLLGSGRSELARTIFGEQRPRAGTIRLDDRIVTFKSPREAIDAGVALVPEDRRGHSAFPGLTVGTNITIADLKPLVARGAVSRSRERREVATTMESFDIRPRAADKEFGLLSGGNQQKAILARWMRLRPRVMVLDEPTQGVDVGAKAEIFALIEQMSADGVATLFISSDLSELTHVCDRVLVLRAGRIVADLADDELREDLIVSQMFLTGGVAA